jgi:hypothetical protein
LKTANAKEHYGELKNGLALVEFLSWVYHVDKMLRLEQETDEITIGHG